MIDVSDAKKVTSDGPHVGSNRSTPAEAQVIRVGPNAFNVAAVERGVWGSQPAALEVPESLYTPAALEAICLGLSLIELGYAAVHSAKEDELKLKGIDVPRAEVHKLVKAAEEAKAKHMATQLETARIEAANLVARAEHEELTKNLDAMRKAAATPPAKATDAQSTEE
jgi:hypothetical protein